MDLEARDEKWRELWAMEGEKKEGTEKTARNRLVSSTEVAHLLFLLPPTPLHETPCDGFSLKTPNDF